MKDKYDIYERWIRGENLEPNPDSRLAQHPKLAKALLFLAGNVTKAAIIAQAATIVLFFPLYFWWPEFAWLYTTFFVIAGIATIRNFWRLAVRFDSIAALISTLISDLLLFILWFAVSYRLAGVSYSDGQMVDSIFACIYFSTITITTLGYGDILPASDISYALVSIEALLGFLYFAFVIGLVSSLTYRRLRSNEKDRQPHDDPGVSD